MKMSRRDVLKGIGVTAAAIVVGACDSVIGETGIANADTDIEKQLLSNHTLFKSSEGCYLDNPVLASNNSGHTWAVWLNRMPDDIESLMYSEFKDKWSDAVQVIPTTGKYESPCISCASYGDPMLIWIEITGEAWILKSSHYNNGKFDKAKTVSSRKGKVKNPSIIALDDGTFWAAWESYRNGRFRISMKQYQKGSWGKEVEITDGQVNSFDPAIAADSKGNIWVSYSAVDRGHRNILLTSYDTASNKLDEPLLIAAGGDMVRRPNTHAYPSLWCDNENRVWVAYEHDSQPSKGTLSYHGFRECSIVCLNEKRQLETTSRNRSVIGSDNDHYPALRTDGFGRLWVFSRKSEPYKRGWNLRGSCLNGSSGWTSPVTLLPDKELGRISRPAVALISGSSFWTAWQEDYFTLGDKWQDNIQSSIHIAKIDMPEPQTNPGSVAFRLANTVKPSDMQKRRPWIKRRKIKVGDEEYTVVYGNMHEHSNLSRCAADGSDGTLDDNYRQGINVEGYDFMAMTDHDFDTNEIAWRETRRTTQFYNSEPNFIALPAYEWTYLNGVDIPPSAGHRNVVFASDADAANFIHDKKTIYGIHMPEGNTIDKVWRLLREKQMNDVVCIAAHPTLKDHPMDWNAHDPEYQTVVEIFSSGNSNEHKGCPRECTSLTKYESCFVQNALARGHKLGFVGCGDHHATGLGATGLLVKEVSRRGLVEAMKARRCFATTGDKIFIDFKVDGHIMGEEFASKDKPHITASLKCTDTIDNIVVFKNNQIIYEKGKKDLGSTKEYEIDFVDESFTSDSYYYLRAIQTNNEIVWSSPVWVKHI
ncbi:MAG: DUF3604 domain-containing protein [Armatimonadota bacterium]